MPKIPHLLFNLKIKQKKSLTINRIHVRTWFNSSLKCLKWKLHVGGNYSIDDIERKAICSHILPWSFLFRGLFIDPRRPNRFVLWTDTIVRNLWRAIRYYWMFYYIATIALEKMRESRFPFVLLYYLFFNNSNRINIGNVK